jgi:hypothetical protein
MPGSRGQTVMTSRRSTLGLLGAGFGDKGLIVLPYLWRQLVRMQGIARSPSVLPLELCHAYGRSGYHDSGP